MTVLTTLLNETGQTMRTRNRLLHLRFHNRIVDDRVSLIAPTGGREEAGDEVIGGGGSGGKEHTPR